MNYEQMWKALKEDMETAVEKGYRQGLHTNLETPDGGRFIAYRYVLDFMNELEEGNGV